MNCHPYMQLSVMVAFAALGTVACAAVVPRQTPDGGVSVQTDAYRVEIGPHGCLQSIVVGGVEMLGRYERFDTASCVLDYVPPGNYGVVHPEMTRLQLDKVQIGPEGTVVATGPGYAVTYTFRESEFDILLQRSGERGGPLLLFPSENVLRSLDLQTDKVISMSEGNAVGQTQEGMRWVTRQGPMLRFEERVDGYASYYWWSQTGDGNQRAVSWSQGQAFKVRPLAQPTAADAMQFVVKADSPDFLMPGGQPVRFDVTAVNGTPAAFDVQVDFEVRDYCTRETVGRSTTTLKMTGQEEQLVKAEVPVAEPGPYRGVLVLKEAGKKVRELGWIFTYDFPNYHPALTRQPDFKEFWKQTLEELAEVPIDAKLTLNEEKSTPQAEVYEVSLATLNGERVWAWYGRPRKPGKYPVLYFCPPTGVYALPLWAGTGNGQYVAFSIAIHGFDLRLSDMPPGDDPRKRYKTAGIESPRTARWRTIYASLVRGMDFLCSRQEVDPERISVSGSSQGGGLAIVLAGLDSRVAFLHPKYSGLPRLDWTVKYKTGYWPFGAEAKPEGQSMEAFLKTLSYFDAANFAPDIHCPAVPLIGMLDWVTASGNQIAAFAHLAPGQVELICDPWNGHGGWSWASRNRSQTAFNRFLASEPPVVHPSK